MCVKALFVRTNAVLRIARSPTARQSLDRLTTITIVEGDRASVTYLGGRRVVTVEPE